MTKRKIWLFIAALLVLGALGSLGSIPYQTSRNEAICPHDKPDCLPPRSGWRNPLHPVPRARLQFEAGDEGVPGVFVGLALSGGGSRAANFSLAAMEQLEEIGLLRHVSAISSTSGGGLAGAYYALKGPDLDWKDAKRLMATDLRTRWVLRNLYPHKLLQTLFTHADRSDLMAEVFEDVLLGTAGLPSPTYAALGAPRAGRPLFIANATNIAGGNRFSFTEEEFKFLRARLDSYPVSHAVMASAAFPGAFNNVTLTRYPPPFPPKKGAPIPRGYEHLLDGGPSDNLGADALMLLAASHHRVTSAGGKTAGQACFIIITDAYPSGVPNRKSWMPDSRGLLDFTIDLNAIEAFDALLTHRRDDLLGALGLRKSAPGDQRYIGDVVQPVEAPGLSGDLITPLAKLVEVDIPIGLRIGQSPTGSARQVSVRPGGAPAAPEPGYFRCTVWHLDLSGMLTVKPYLGDAGKEPRRLQRMTEYEHPLIHHRIRLSRVVSQTDTDFRLSGPAGCSAQKLQDALYAAAFVAVREDHYTRPKVCEWFRRARLSVSPACDAFPGNKTLQELTLDIRADGPSIAGKPGSQAVACEN
jgi:NTE family protein